MVANHTEDAALEQDISAEETNLVQIAERLKSLNQALGNYIAVLPIQAELPSEFRPHIRRLQERVAIMNGVVRQADRCHARLTKLRGQRTPTKAGA